MRNKSSEGNIKKSIARKSSLQSFVYKENTVGYAFISLFIIGFLVFTVIHCYHPCIYHSQNSVVWELRNG